MYMKDLEKLNNILHDYKPNIISHKELKKKYKNELQDYNIIDNLEDFININKGCSIKPIKKSSEELQKGGVVVKVDKNINNKWFVLITLPKLNYFWRVYFDDNHIFIRTPNKYRNLFESFISKEDVKKYNVKSNINDITSTIMDKYKKKKN